MELTREYILRLQKNRRGTTGGSGTAGTSGNYVTPAQLESALANKVDVDFFSRLFELYNGEGTTAAKIETNATLPDDTSKLNIKATFDFWSQRSVSALGMSSGGSTSVFDEAAMWTALGGSIDNQQIAPSHLTTALNGYVKGVKVGETTYSPNASGIVDLGTITGRTYAFATGTTNGTFKVTPSVGDAYEVAIKGLGSLAYKSGLTAEDIPNLDATKITTGILGVDRIPGLAASKIVSGTLDADRIPGLAASKIVSGTLSADRIPSLSWNKITTDKPTTLSDYGITDAKIVDGVITLGGNSITPLTDAKIKSGYEWWGQKLDASGKVTGLLSSVSGIKINSTGSGYGYIDFHYASASSFTSNIFEAQSGQLAINNLLYVKKGGYVGIGTNSPSTLLHVNGYARMNRLYLQSDSVYFELDSDGNVHLVGAGFYSDSFVSALGKGDSGSSFVLNEPLQSINTAFSANPSASQAGYAIVWNGSGWTYGKAASDGVDMNAVWTALNGSTGGKQINTAWLTGVTKTLTIKDGNGTTLGTYNGTAAQTITINDMAAKQLTASTIDSTAGSFFFYGDNLINNQYDWVGIQVDNANKDRGQLVWCDNTLMVRQNDADNTPAASWGEWALVLTNKNYASQIAAGTITNAMLAGSIANNKLANSSVTVNGTSVSLGGSVTTAKWGTARNINIASSDGTGASTSVSVDGSAAKTLLLPSTIKASLTGNADTATTASKLSTVSKTAWGQTYWTAGGVPTSISGTLSNVLNIEFTGVPSSAGHGGYLDFHYNGSSADYTSRIIEEASGKLAINSALWVNNSGYVGIGTNSPSTLLHVNGYTRTNRLYLQSDSVYFELDSSGNVHLVGAGFYSDSFISALGLNDSGGGGGEGVYIPLGGSESISGQLTPDTDNAYNLGNGNKRWKTIYSTNATINLLSVNGTATINGSLTAIVGAFSNQLSLGGKAVATQEWVTNNYYIGPIAAGSYDFNFADDITTGGVYQVHAGSATKQSSWPFDYGLVANFVSTNGHLQFAASSDKNDIRIRSYWWTGSSSFGAYPEWKTLLHSGNTYISGQTITINGTSLTVPTGTGGDCVAKTGDTMTGGLTINYNNGTALSVNGAYSLSGVGTLSGLNLTASASQGITFKGSSTGRSLLGLDWYTNSAGTLTVSNSTDNSGIFSYGGFKKSGSSDSYVLLGGGGHKALSDFVRVHSNSISGNIYSVPCGTIFSGVDIADAPTTGWVSGIALGSNFNSNHYQSYLVESSNGNWYVTRSYQNGAMINWKTLLDSNNYMQYTSAINNSANAGGGSAGWIRVAILKIIGSWVSQPIFMRVVQRGGYAGDLRIYFNNQNTTDPTLNSLTYTGTLKTVKLIRYTAGTWHLYVQKSENYDEISVSVRDMTPYMQARVTVTYDNVFSSSEPTGTDFSNGSSGNWYAACEEFFSNGDGTMKIYGVSSGYGDERIAIQTSFDGQDPKTSTYPSSYPTRACLLLQPRGGNVGIGTTSPSYTLHVNGSAYARILTVNGMEISWDTSLGKYYFNTDNQDVETEGTWRGTFVSGSDIRLKDIDRYLDGKLEDIARAPIFSFGWKDKKNKQLQLGTSAQYWQDILPFGVFADARGYLALDYGATALAAAVFTARKVVDHELRIKQLQERIKELETELDELKAA